MTTLEIGWPATLDELKAKLTQFLTDNPDAAASRFVGITLEEAKTGSRGRAPTTLRVAAGNPSDDAARKAEIVANHILFRVAEYPHLVARVHLNFTTPKTKQVP